jgi:Flp pilus assembly protein TadD
MKKKLVQVWLVILTVGVSLFAQDNLQKALAYNEQGIEQFKAGKHDAAIESFNLAIARQPDNATFHYNLGVVFYHSKQPEKAKEALQKTVALFPAYADAYNLLGLIEMETGQYKKAVEVLRESIRLKPDSSIIHNNLGLAYIRLEKFREAAETLKQAKLLGSANPETSFHLAFVYTKQKRYPEAIAEVRPLIDANPNDGRARLLLGTIYLLAKDKQSALSEYQKIRAFDAPLAQKLYQAIYSDKIVFVP